RIRRGRQELAVGHLEAAEKEFRAALAAEPGNAAAHRGLGEIARRQGKMEEAVKELQASLATRDSAEVRTMLAKIYLDQKKPELARVSSGPNRFSPAWYGLPPSRESPTTPAIP